MNKILILLIVSLCFAEDPYGKYADNGPIIKSLAAYVESEHAQIKEAIDQDYYPVVFNWKFCSMSAFPILPGKRCPYFPDYNREKYRSINWRGSTAYIQSPSLIYVGTQYWFSDNRGHASDTTSYRVIAYKLIKEIKEPPYFLWERTSEIITVTCKYQEVISVEGEEIY